MLRDHAVAPRTDAQEDWPAMLDQYGVQFLALDVEGDAGLYERFRGEPCWLIDYEDKESVLFVRARLHQEVPSVYRRPHLKGALVE